MAQQDGFTDEQIRLVLESRGIEGADIERLLAIDKTRELTEEKVKAWVLEALEESQQPQPPPNPQRQFAEKLAGGLAGARSQWISGEDAGGSNGEAA
jgi:hypothetical protein